MMQLAKLTGKGTGAQEITPDEAMAFIRAAIEGAETLAIMFVINGETWTVSA